MARRPLLTIDGVTYNNVYSVSYNIHTAKDETGRPSGRAHIGTIKITREADENTGIYLWSLDSSHTGWKSGEVEIRTPEGGEMKKLTWTDGFVAVYEETVPHLKEHPDDQVYEYCEISCRIIAIGDNELDDKWKV